MYNSSLQNNRLEKVKLDKEPENFILYHEENANTRELKKLAIIFRVT